MHDDDEDCEGHVVSRRWTWSLLLALMCEFWGAVFGAVGEFWGGASLALVAHSNHTNERREFRESAGRDIERITAQ